MVRVVLYDACALYGNTIRDLLVRVARAGLVQAKWTDQILDENGLVRSAAALRFDWPGTIA